MSQQESEKAENLRELLRQHWLHCRHLESERAWFMSVYAAITGAMLTYLFTADMMRLWPLIFLIFLTAVGLLLNIRWMQAFEHHRRLVKETASKIGVTAEVDVPAKHIWKILRTRYLFPSFYCIILIGLIVLLVTNSA